MKNRNLFLLTSGLAFPLLGAYAQKTPKPNIIYIMCDDMGYGDLGCYGQSYISTPNIDNMAKEGMRFTQAYAGSPVSAPSRASFMTGQHSGHCEVRGNKEYWRDAPVVMYGNNKEYAVVGQHPYDPGHVIIPEIMKDNGYTTGMFGKWAGGYEGSVSTPDKRGIDEYYPYICAKQSIIDYECRQCTISDAQRNAGILHFIVVAQRAVICFGYHSKIERSPAHCSRRDALSAAYPAEKR